LNALDKSNMMRSVWIPYEDFLPGHVRKSTTVSRSYVWPEIHVDSLLGSYVHQGGSGCLSQLYA
jgi:hypothetical protein